MSPHPAITPAPVLPRQQNPNDPYGISSMLASLSALYPDIYSDSFNSYSLDAYYSSLMSEYSSLTAIYSLTGFPTVPTATATRPRVTSTTSVPTRTGASSVTGTAAGASGTGIPDNTDNNNKGGLSTGAKAGIGVGVVLGLLLLAGIGILIWCMGKRKGKNSTTVVAQGGQSVFAGQQQPPPQTPQQFQQQPQMGYVNNQGYMQGVPQQGYPQQTMSPPPQYAQQQAAAGQPGMAGAYAPYAKGPDPNVAELEHEYHFAKPGVVEIGDGTPEQGANRQS